jgi:hypothetical protein
MPFDSSFPSLQGCFELGIEAWRWLRASYLAHNHLLFRSAYGFGRLKQPSLWASHGRAHWAPLTPLLCPLVGRLKGGAVAEVMTLRSRSASVVLLNLPEQFLRVCVEVAGENLAEHADQ